MLPAVIGLLVAVVVLLVVWRLLRALLLVAVVIVLAGLFVGFADHHLHARRGTTAIAAIGRSISRDVDRARR